MPRLALPVEPNGAFLDRTEMSDADVAAIKQVAERSMQSNFERVTALPRAADVDALFLMQGQNEAVCGEGSVLGSGRPQWSTVLQLPTNTMSKVPIRPPSPSSLSGMERAAVAHGSSSMNGSPSK